MGRQSRCNRPPPSEGSGAFDSKAPMYWVVPQAPPPSYNQRPTGVNRPYSCPDTQLDFAYKSASSASAGGKRRMAMNLLADGLEGLKGTTAAAVTCLPYISTISSLLRLTINIRDEMKQYDDDGEVVTYKLEKITSLLNNLGKLCALHQLEERDLPPSLHGIFQCLRIELDEVRLHLVESTNVRSTMKKIILRKDTIRTVKQCDIKLSSMLQRFQVALTIDARLEQIKVIRNLNSHGRCPYDDRVIRLPRP